MGAAREVSTTGPPMAPSSSLQGSGNASKEQSPSQSEAERSTASLRALAGRRGKAL